MIKFIRYHFARFMQRRLVSKIKPNQITKEMADMWNHLEFVKISRGRKKINWGLIKWE